MHQIEMGNKFAPFVVFGLAAAISTALVQAEVIDSMRVLVALRLMAWVSMAAGAALVLTLLWQRCGLEFWHHPFDTFLAGLAIELSGFALHQAFW